MEEGGKVVTGPELSALSDAELEELSSSIKVYARVSPTDKLRIVKALKSRGEVVIDRGRGE